MNKTEVKIPEMLFFQEGPGVRNTQYTSSGVKLLNVANLVDGKVDLSTSYRYISEDEAYGKYRHFLCDEGDFIVASSGIKVDYIDKKMGFISREMLPLCMNTSTIRFKVLDGSKLNIKYFMYFLKSTAFKKQLAKQITGSAQLNYGPSHLKQMTFPLIDIKIQNDLVQKLDSIMRIIDQKNASLKKLDELVKARFVEMFEANMDTVPLRDICKTASGGTPSTKYPDYYKGTIPWISTTALGSNHISGDSAKAYITKEAIDNSATRLIPKENLLFGIRVGVGKTSINDVDICINQDIVAITNIDEARFSKLFIKHVLDANQAYYDSLKKGATILGITSDDLKNTPIPLVSFSRQKSFESFVEQVDKSKFAVQKSLEKTQLLFDSLMQEYFG